MMNPLNHLFTTPDSVLIKDIRPGLKNFTITFIVLDVGMPVPLKENREVRTLKVADHTACINLSLWDEPGAALSPGDIVRLNKAYAGVWRSALTLYSGKNGDIDKVGEFCFIFNEQLNMSEPNMNFSNAIPNQPGSGMVSVNNNMNNGNANNIGVLQNRPPSLSVPQTINKNAPRYSGDREREQPLSGSKHSGKGGSRSLGRGAQRGVIRNDKR